MKIAIDISQLVYETGVSEYTKNLIEALLQVDHKNDYLLFGGSLRRTQDLRAKTRDLRGNFKTKFLPISPEVANLLWNKLHFLKIERLIGEVDVLHTSDWSEPPSDAYKVTTIHDLSPLLFPKQTHPKIVSVHKRKLYWVKKETQRVIVPSEASKADALSLGINESKIRVIPEAASSIFKRKGNREIELLKHKYNIKGDYLLAVGATWRKNTKRILEAFTKMKKENLVLVVIGRQLKTFESHEGVIFTSHVRREELPIFYSGAKALVYPSLHEGFGLPILEAFACGAPVVTSNISSMKEVAGGAAALVEPTNIDSLVEGIEKVLSKREYYIQKGTERVKQFSWNRAARETLAVYQEASR